MGYAWIYSRDNVGSNFDELPSENCKDLGLWIYTPPSAPPKDAARGFDLDNLEADGKFVRITAKMSG